MNISTTVNTRRVAWALSFILALLLAQRAFAENNSLVNITTNSTNKNSSSAFLDYVQQQEQKEPKRQTDTTSPGDNKINDSSKRIAAQNKHTAPQQSSIIQQKDKTIRQLQAQLKSKVATEAALSDSQKGLLSRISDLQGKLNQSTAENDKKRLAVSDKAAQSAVNESTKNLLAAMASEKQKLAIQLAALTAEKQTLAATLAATQEKNKGELASLLKIATDEKQALTAELAAITEKQAANTRFTAAASEKEIQAFDKKLSAAIAETQTLKAKLKSITEEKQNAAAKLAAAEVEKLALMAKIDSFSLTKQQSVNAENALKLQAEKDKAMLLAKTDEISQLKAKLTQTQTLEAVKSAPVDLSLASQQQDYAIGTSIGDEALKVLSTRNSLGLKIDKSLVLQGITDTFAEKNALDKEALNQALSDASSHFLKKIEEKASEEGKKYQTEFSQQKGVLFKDGVYSRIDSAGKGKIIDSDTLAVTIKEMLTDGTVISDMEAEGKVWTQELRKFPPIFLEPLKRLGNQGAITIVVPPEQAYGSEGIPSVVPPGSTMVYSVRVIDVKAAKPQAKKP